MSTQQYAVPSALPLRTRILRYPLILAIVGILATIAPMFVTLGLTEIVPKPLRLGWPMLLSAAVAVAGYRWFVMRLERRPVTELALAGAGRELWRGLGIGVLLVVATYSVLLASGAFIITGAVAPGVLLKPFPEQVMVAIFEEIVFRAIVFGMLQKFWGTKIALGVSTVIFVVAHMPNGGFNVLGAAMTAVASLALSGAYLLSGRLWLPIGLHFAWNFLCDAVFAVSVSGHPARGWLQVSTSGPAWLSGGDYGVEGSIVTGITWSMAAIALLAIAYRRGHWR
ncbi:MAG: type II CAAX endopeptidase family protein [Massilia sp.]|uniref:CPBP family intramembrane glutamic endopeptidase n=1 Tax=Massilia sp. TaxID=1882437 RepID=UPI0019B0E00E|nr:CPBP family intramembrane metalloprotease [Oxalobacteraceae sp. CFBP 8761]